MAILGNPDFDVRRTHRAIGDLLEFATHSLPSLEAPFATALAMTAILCSSTAHAELSAEELAKLAQNPVANW